MVRSFQESLVGEQSDEVNSELQKRHLISCDSFTLNNAFEVKTFFKHSLD